MASVDYDPGELIEAYFERGWTDGLPVVPPSEKSIDAMLAGAGLRGDETIGEIAERGVVVSAEKLAINAVMAGCRPEYLPVVVAVRGLCHPHFAYHGPASSTGGSAMVLIVNGPIASRIGMNSGNNVFGQGARANATIGRAVRLVMMNVINTRPGFLDRATLGTPGKYSFCFAENESRHPWEPLHVERGYRPEQSAVTVYASNSLCQVYNQLAAEPEPLLRCFADALCNLGTPNLRGFNESLVVFAGEHAIRCAGAAGASGRAALSCGTRARYDLARQQASGDRAADETTWKHAFERLEDILIVCAGGEAGSWSACLPGWGNKWTRSITTPIDTQ
jgi:hypothetical protein